MVQVIRVPTMVSPIGGVPPGSAVRMLVAMAGTSSWIVAPPRSTRSTPLVAHKRTRSVTKVASLEMTSAATGSIRVLVIV